MIIEVDFRFDSAHFLPYVPADHKCRNMHGHTYWAILAVKGETDSKGWVKDFAEIRKVVNPLIEKLDHKLLNAVPGLENPTAENIAEYIYHNAKKDLPELDSVQIKETPFSRCIYYGEK